MRVEQLQAIFVKKGYVWDSRLNIVGVRNGNAKKITNLFDDNIFVAYKESGVWLVKGYSATTDPGRYYTKVKLLSPKGAAILKEGQYRGVYAIRKHQNKYEALCQTWGNVVVYRDGNKDDVYDFSVTEAGQFGINLHKAGAASLKVENWSAGCQVFARSADFEDFMAKIRPHKAELGNKYTYTLINSIDL